MAGDYDLQSIWEAMEDDLIASYRRNMVRHTSEEAGSGFSWPMWQEIKFQDLKRFEEDIAGLMKKYGGRSDRTVTRAMKENFTDGISNADRLLDGLKVSVSSSAGFFKANERRLAALQTAIGSDMADAKQAVLRMSDDVFRQTIYKAQTFYTAGASTLWQAVDMASKDFLSRGINCIEYSNGARVNIASYAEMALLASAKKAYMVGEGRRSAEYGVTLCQVTQYSACSPTCQPWQGRQYIDDVYAGGKTGDGDCPLLSLAIDNGLFHPHCRHIKQPWYPGISEELQPIDAAEMGENYDTEQRQHEIERYIRQCKRREAGSLDTKNQVTAHRKVQDWQAEMRQYLKDNPQLHRDYAREKIYDMGASSPKPAPPGAKDSFSQKSEFNTNATFKISIPDFSEKINKSISGANLQVVTDGVKTGNEHLILVDLETGKWEHQEEGDSESVGGPQFFAFMDEHPSQRFAFVHNHPSGEMPSLTDLSTYLEYPNIGALVAAGHNGAVYYVYGTKAASPQGGAYLDAIHHDDQILADLRKRRKQGTIDTGDYHREADRLRAEYILKTYCGGKLFKEET